MTDYYLVRAEYPRQPWPEARILAVQRILQWAHSLWRVVALLFYVLLANAALLAIALTWWPSAQIRALDEFTSMVALVTLGVLVVLSIPGLFFWSRFQWLPMSECKVLLELFEAQPTLRPYYEQVLAMGRRFTKGEFSSLLSWIIRRGRKESYEEYLALVASKEVTSKQEAERYCRRLYRVPPATATSPAEEKS